MTKKLTLLKYTGSRAKWALVLAAIVASSVAAIAAVDVDGKFSLFGHAQWVTGGPAPGETAIDLTSNCTPFTGTTCTGTTTFSGVTFTPKAGHPVILSDISILSTDFNIGASDCGGGSPRFEIDYATAGNIFVYFGPYPNFVNCFFGWQNTGNVIGSTALIWDTSQRAGGTFYDTHAHALTVAGSQPISSISIVVDGGWRAVPICPTCLLKTQGQDVTISHFTINDNVFPPRDKEGEEHWK